jgi:hypothetical protein
VLALFKLLVQEIFSKDHKQAVKILTQFHLKCLEEGVFQKVQEEIEVKGSKNSKIKLIQFGFTLWNMLLEAMPASFGHKCLTPECLLSSNFKMVLMRTLASQKSNLNPLAQELKVTLTKQISASNLTSPQALNLLKSLFGPNMYEQFTLKRNSELLKALGDKMEQAEAVEYVQYLEGIAKNPQVEDFYQVRQEKGAQKDKEEEDNESE